MRELLHTVVAALGRLSRREQRLVATFALVLLLAGLYVFAIEPTLSARERMERRIQSLGNDLRTMESLATRIARLESGLAREAKPSAAGKDFSLFSFIDKATSASVSSEAVTSMNPSRRPAREGFEESAVELRLNRVTLPEVVGLLRQIEDAAQPVYIKRLELKRRYDDDTRFDAILIAGSVSRT